MLEILITAFAVLFPFIVYFIMRVASAAFFHEKLRYQQRLIRNVSKRSNY